MSFHRRADRPLIYGHRGARARAPDNTLEAFALAMAEGADGVELDVRVTADARLVLFHDGHVTAGKRRKRISDLSYTQLCHLQQRSVPTLADALDFRDRTGALLNVELKGDVPHKRWLAEATCRELTSRGTRGVLVSSFHPDLLLHVRRQLPELPTGMLLAESHRLAPRLVAWLVRRVGAQALHPEVSLTTRALLFEMKKTKTLVNVWTVNDPRDIARLSTWGVDGLITDQPRETLDVLTPGVGARRPSELATRGRLPP